MLLDSLSNSLAALLRPEQQPPGQGWTASYWPRRGGVDVVYGKARERVERHGVVRGSSREPTVTNRREVKLL